MSRKPDVTNRQYRIERLHLEMIWVVSRAGVKMTKYILIAFGAGFFIWCAKDVLIEFAGKKTDANILVNFLAGFDISERVAYLFGAGGIGYGWLERRTRKRSIAESSRHTERLEKHLDKRRTSSNLTRQGKNKREDLL